MKIRRERKPGPQTDNELDDKALAIVKKGLNIA